MVNKIVHVSCLKNADQSPVIITQECILVKG